MTFYTELVIPSSLPGLVLDYVFIKKMITVDYMNVVDRSERRRISVARGFDDVGDIKLVLLDVALRSFWHLLTMLRDAGC